MSLSSEKPPTLEEICKYHEVSCKELDQECSEESLSILAEVVSGSNWKSIATRLGIPEDFIDDIDNEYKRVQERKKAIITKWKSMLSFKATYSSFMNIFLEMKMADSVTKVIKLLKEKGILTLKGQLYSCSQLLVNSSCSQLLVNSSCSQL